MARDIEPADDTRRTIGDLFVRFEDEGPEVLEEVMEEKEPLAAATRAQPNAALVHSLRQRRVLGRKREMRWEGVGRWRDERKGRNMNAP